MKIVYLSGLTPKEIKSRTKYLYDTFHLYFAYCNRNGFYEFVSIPSTINDSIIIYGHNNLVNLYLRDSDIQEKNIYLITCNYDFIIKFRNKNAFISKLDGNSTNLYDGKDYGFDFPITESELIMYNNKNLKFDEQMNLAFERVSC